MITVANPTVQLAGVLVLENLKDSGHDKLGNQVEALSRAGVGIQ